MEIAQTFAGEAGKEVAATQAAVLRSPSARPPATRHPKLADSTFAQVYGRIAISVTGAWA